MYSEQDKEFLEEFQRILTSLFIEVYDSRESFLAIRQKLGNKDFEIALRSLKTITGMITEFSFNHFINGRWAPDEWAKMPKDWLPES